MDDQKYLTRVMKKRQAVVDAVENLKLTTVEDISKATHIGVRAVRSIIQVLYPNLAKPTTRPHIFFTSNMAGGLSDNLHIGIHSFAKRLRAQCKDEGLHIPSISTISNKTRAAIEKFLTSKDKPDIPIIDLGDYDIILISILDQNDDEYIRLYGEHQKAKITK